MSVRAPLWKPRRLGDQISPEAYKAKQRSHLARWRAAAKEKRWGDIQVLVPVSACTCRCGLRVPGMQVRDRFRCVCGQAGHYDWFLFPIDDGSQQQWNLRGEDDVAALRADNEWLANYRESVRLCVASWGWDVDGGKRFAPPERGMRWTDWDVRLAKITRSLWLLEDETYFASVQAFAKDVQTKEKCGRSFFYGGICLDEILHMRLPRREGAAARGSKREREEDSDAGEGGSGEPSAGSDGDSK